MLSPEKLGKIAEAVSRGESPGATVRTILSWFDAQRRGYWVVSAIRAALDDVGLVTDPDFESAYIDSVVEFRKKPTAITVTGSVSAQPATASGTAHVGAALPSSASVPDAPSPAFGQPFLPADPSFRLSKLAAANNVPLSVVPDAPLEEAVTKMLTHDYSQLPIMQGDREVRGAISWRSIASRLATGKNGLHAREFADRVEVVDSTSSLFDAVSLVIQN
jgi:CBS domain-containing protein